MIQLIEQRKSVITCFLIGYLNLEDCISVSGTAVDYRIALIIVKNLPALRIDILSASRLDRFSVGTRFDCETTRSISAYTEQARYAAGRYRGLTVTVRVTVRQFVFVYGTDDGCVYGTRNVVNNRHIKT